MKITVYPLILILALTACNPDGNKTSPEEQADAGTFLRLNHQQITANGMTEYTVTQREFRESITANGIVDVPPGSRALISAVMGGYIKDAPLLIGDAVKKGQVVVTLENPEYVSLQQEYLELQEQLAFLEEEFNRQKQLREEDISSRKNYLRAESNYKSARARSQGLEGRLQMLGLSPDRVREGRLSPSIGLRSPISGSVTRILAVRGAYVPPESGILELIDRDHLHLELQVFEKDIMKVSVGQEVRFSIPESSETVFRARVVQVGKSLEENRSVRVHADLDETVRQEFLVGMFVQAQILQGNYKNWALPESAISRDGDTAYIYVFESAEGNDRLYRKLPVNTGTRTDGWVEWLDAGVEASSMRILTQIQNLH